MTNYSNAGIAFFDFDGTITSKDTLAELLKFVKGKLPYYARIALLSPVIAAYKARIISNHKAKELLLSSFLKGMPEEKFNALCEEFSQNHLQLLFRQNALQEIRRHLQNGTKVVIVSASPENWIAPWCRQFGIDIIATKLQVTNGKITGKIEGRNCHGYEKVKHILKNYNLSQYNKIYAYGDTPGDFPMLALSTHSFYKPFKERTF